jgi:hypothetical protein
MWVIFEAYFLQCNICFKYVSNILYQRESKIYSFSFPWIYNDLHVNLTQIYSIQNLNEKLFLNTILINQI